MSIELLLIVIKLVSVLVILMLIPDKDLGIGLLFIIALIASNAVLGMISAHKDIKSRIPIQYSQQTGEPSPIDTVFNEIWEVVK